MFSNGNYINFNTDQGKKDKIPGKPRILIAPLDWGLGHATRCIPIIRELMDQNCEIWLAGDGAIEKLLRAEFPQLPFLSIDGYKIHYSKSGIGLLINLVWQLPKILSAINSEKRWLNAQIGENGFDAVISDNRFGLHHDSIPCIFITHQLQIKGISGRWQEKILQRWNYSYINRFSECWVPDVAGDDGLAGDLSHPKKMPSIPVHYLGTISRFMKLTTEERKNHLTVILSGPEPQRSLFEDILIDQIVHYNGTVDFIRGLPATNTILPSTNQLHFYNHLRADELNKKIAVAEFVISRSGYSTIMDLIQLQKKSILVPTPGQTEQEYLAQHLMQKKMAYCVKQEGFGLTNELREARKFPYQFPHTGTKVLKKKMEQFISRLSHTSSHG